MTDTLSTDAYKGTRDFYPEDMAVQRHIFETWARVAESFGYEMYDASILEPAELYRLKTSEEIVNEQTYTFTDRGDREVTLRPEMTPTAARMVAAKRRELTFPVRWYSIPNLFRYERPQRGRLREHWQLNCDIFGVSDVAADIEMISLAYNVLKAFGASDDMFEIRLNDRSWMNELFKKEGLTQEQSVRMLALLDRKEKIQNFSEEAAQIAGKPFNIPEAAPESISGVIEHLQLLGIQNARFSPSTVRGFNYYTGIVFEIFDVSESNNRSLIGGGRYDNLTALFGGDPIPGVGFGMGDVTMRDFLETHNLLPKDIRVTAPTLVIIPAHESLNMEGERIAQEFRNVGVSATVDFSDRKMGKKIATAGEKGAVYALIFGENEKESGTYTLKELSTSEEKSGTIAELVAHIA